MTSLIVGAGYCAKFLYKQLSHSEDGDIYTLSRSQSFQSNPYHLSCNLDKQTVLETQLSKLKVNLNILTVFYLAPPLASGLHDTRIAHFLNTLPNNLSTKIIYISTSGVYGNRNGEWVDENTPVMPETDRAKRRVSAETQLLASKHKVIILRTPGIYGPDRLPIDKIKKRNKIISTEDCGYTNLIQVEDLVRIMLAAAEYKGAETIFNVSDGTPIKSSNYYKAVARIANLKPPEEVSYKEALDTFDNKRLSFLQESRRLNTLKLSSQLQTDIVYKNIDDGILAALNYSN